MQKDINDILNIWEATPVTDACCFCGGDTEGLTSCCDEGNYEWDADETKLNNQVIE